MSEQEAMPQGAPLGEAPTVPLDRGPVEQGPTTEPLPALTEQAQTPTPEADRPNRFGSRAGIGALVVALLAGGAWTNRDRLFAGDDGPQKPVGGANTLELTREEIREIFDVSLYEKCDDTVAKTDTDAEVKQGIIVPHVSALDSVGRGNHGFRIDSDALGYRLESPKNKPATVLDEAQSRNCQDPLQEQSFEYVLANTKIAGEPIRDIVGGFLEDAPRTPAEINDRAEHYLPGINGLTTAEEAIAESRYEQFIERAGKVNTILNRFKNMGIKIKTTALNVHLAKGGQAPDNHLAEVARDANYKGKFLTLLVTLKRGVCLAAFGINPGDTRPAILQDQDCQPEKPQSKPPVTSRTPQPTSTPPPTPGPSPKVENTPGDLPPVQGPGAGGTRGPRGTTSQAPTPTATHTESARPPATPTPTGRPPEQTPSTEPTTD